VGDLLKGIEYLGIPMTVAIVLVSIWLILHIIGFVLDIKGKVLPEIINIRGYVRRKKEEKKKQSDLLERLEKKLNSFDKHYSKDNIAKRDNWMEWVNNRAAVYDDALSKLLLLQDKLNENNEITLDLYINVNRNRILDFARIVADDKTLASREEFNRIYKVNKEYHAILDKYNKENGEVDTAMKLINEAYDYRMKNHSFIEDIRGYNN
jgi:hypothetical protein